jgi:glycosyltransferase A (GT-A) superfamily protein (DUF2064 family)
MRSLEASLSACLFLYLAQRLPRRLVIGPAAKGRTKLIGCPRSIAQFFEAMPQVEMRVGMIGLETEGAAETVGQLGVPALRRL